jgi:hypothetical protein
MKKAKKLLVEAGLDKTHWGARIIYAEEVEFTTEDDKEDAADWITCACGRQDPRIEKQGDGLNQPKDRELVSLGLRFNESIYDNDMAYAATLLISIEERAAIVLAKTLEVR